MGKGNNIWKGQGAFRQKINDLQDASFTVKEFDLIPFSGYCFEMFLEKGVPPCDSEDLIRIQGHREVSPVERVFKIPDTVFFVLKRKDVKGVFVDKDMHDRPPPGMGDFNLEPEWIPGAGKQYV